MQLKYEGARSGFGLESRTLNQKEKPMNINVSQSSSTSAFVKSCLGISSSARVLKPIQNRTTTTERIQPAIESKVNFVSDVYYPNVLNSPLSFTKRLENSMSETVQSRNKTNSKKLLYWWC